MADTYVNGNRVSIVDQRLTLNGEEIALGAVLSLNWNGTLDPGIIQGNAVQSAGRTSGYYNATCDFEILLDEADQFESDLTNDGSTGLLQTDFDLQIQYALPDESFVQTVSIRGARIKDHGVSSSAGNDALRMKYDCTVIRSIVVNDRPDVIESQ